MANLIDYILWRGDLCFDLVPPNEIDGLVFSAFSYIQLKNIVAEDFSNSLRLVDVAEQFFQLPEETQLDMVRKPDDIELFRLMSLSPRYKDIEILAHQTIQDNSLEVQFAAYTLKLSPMHHMVVFRGTDTSLIGWKEDLNMSYIDDLPGQIYAKDYLTYIAKNTLGSLWVCGHSKGGNLAVYSSSMVSSRIQKRILQVFNYDGPGFMQKFLERPGYQAMLNKIHTLVPQSSVVGMLLSHEEPYQVAKSTNIGIAQHDPYSWEIMGPAFIKGDALDSAGRIADGSIRSWLAGLDRKEREDFVSAIHSICMESKPEKLMDLAKPQNLVTIIKAYSNADEETKQHISQTLVALGKAMNDTMKQEFKSSFSHNVTE